MEQSLPQIFHDIASPSVRDIIGQNQVSKYLRNKTKIFYQKIPKVPNSFKQPRCKICQGWLMIPWGCHCATPPRISVEVRIAKALIIGAFGCFTFPADLQGIRTNHQNQFMMTCALFFLNNILISTIYIYIDHGSWTDWTLNSMILHWCAAGAMDASTFELVPRPPLFGVCGWSWKLGPGTSNPP